MSKPDVIKTVIEIALAALLLLGVWNKPKLIAFEDWIAAAVAWLIRKIRVSKEENAR